jgi:hypothetical protein
MASNLVRVTTNKKQKRGYKILYSGVQNNGLLENMQYNNNNNNNNNKLPSDFSEEFNSK